MSDIVYRYGNDLEVDAVIDLLRASTLGARRPIDDRDTIAAMLAHANLVVTAWAGERMVGFARTLTDFVYVGYMSDLAVREAFQRRGVGVELIRKTREKMGPDAKIVLLAAPAAVDYYPRVGFTRHDSAWILGGADTLPPP